MKYTSLINDFVFEILNAQWMKISHGMCLVAIMILRHYGFTQCTKNRRVTSKPYLNLIFMTQKSTPARTHVALANFHMLWKTAVKMDRGSVHQRVHRCLLQTGQQGNAIIGIVLFYPIWK